MRISLMLVASAVLQIACAGSQASAPPAATGTQPAATTGEPGPSGAAPHGMSEGEMAARCPMKVQGTTARAEDVDGGAAIAFTTTGDVAELRRRLAHTAEMHNEHHGGDGHGMGMHGGGMMPASTARSEEIENGARLVLLPRDPADLPKLREHARQHAEQMASGQCPMMAMHGEHGGGPNHEAHHPPAHQ